jgi:hypothetical protein
MNVGVAVMHRGPMTRPRRASSGLASASWSLVYRAALASWPAEENDGNRVPGKHVALIATPALVACRTVPERARSSRFCGGVDR